MGFRGNITGTTGRKLRIEGININLSQDTVHSLTGTIMYRTHVQDIGWTGWKTLGNILEPHVGLSR